MNAPAFSCRMCGQCCEGRGGIVVSPADQARLCQALEIDMCTFHDRYTELRNGKRQLRTGQDGCCLFFHVENGCAVHSHKPAVCRAWPFFRGNMVDPVSFSLAREYCPGISAHVSHDTFVAEGIGYIRREELFVDDSGQSGTALFDRDQLNALAASLPCSSEEQKA